MIQEGCCSKFFTREKNDLLSFDIWRASAAEWLGMLFVALFGAGAGLYHELNPSSAPSSVHIALEAGFMIGCMVTVFGTVSGGHVNPAITMGFVVTREITVVRSVFYIVAQTLGGICGCGILHLITPTGMQKGTFGLILPGIDVTDVQALITEIIITFFLLFGTFAMIDKGRNDLQGTIPFMIGLLVTINIFFAGVDREIPTRQNGRYASPWWEIIPSVMGILLSVLWNISGGCMNPARNFGPAVVTGKYDRIWLYWVGPMVGAAMGALVYDKVFSTKACSKYLAMCGSHPVCDIVEKGQNGNIISHSDARKPKEQDITITEAEANTITHL